MTFIVRYLVLHVIFLAGFPVSYAMGMHLMYFYGFMGIFTFFQVLASISPDFLDRAGLWKPIVISVTVLTYVPILWWFGRLAAGIAGSGSDWWLVTSWMPFHFFAAFFAWLIRETIRSAGTQNTAVSSAPDIPTESATSENLGESSGTDAPAATPASAEADADTDTDTDTDKQ